MQTEKFIHILNHANTVPADFLAKAEAHLDALPSPGLKVPLAAAISRHTKPIVEKQRARKSASDKAESGT